MLLKGGNAYEGLGFDEKVVVNLWILLNKTKILRKDVATECKVVARQAVSKIITLPIQRRLKAAELNALANVFNVDVSYIAPVENKKTAYDDLNDEEKIATHLWIAIRASNLKNKDLADRTGGIFTPQRLSKVITVPPKRSVDTYELSVLASVLKVRMEYLLPS